MKTIGARTTPEHMQAVADAIWPGQNVRIADGGAGWPTFTGSPEQIAELSRALDERDMSWGWTR